MIQQASISRREAIALAGVATAAALGASLHAAEEKTPWIDAHSHIWTPDTDRFPLVAGLTKADLKPASFTDEELMKVARPAGVGRVVLIQHSVYHLWDNSYILDAIRRHPKVFRGVGMIDDSKPGAGAEMKRLLPLGVTGFRITPFVRKETPAAWLESEGMREMWATGAKTRQAMCCLINPSDLASVDSMCERYPETPVVIDHFARIGADGEIREADVAKLCSLAKRKQLSVKVSAFYALGKKEAPYLDLVPMIKRVYEAYGPERLMWASDSPYQLGGGHEYAPSIALVRGKLDFLKNDDKEWLLRKTAEKVYFFA
jgi:predicted TIM-barrel fold metal-dependent hydrolase